LNCAEHCLGVTGESLRPIGNAEEIADSAQCRRGFGETAADQHCGDVRLLLHLIGERNVSRGRAADVEHQIRRQPHDIFEINCIAPAGKPSDLRQLGILHRQKGLRLRTRGSCPAQHFLGCCRKECYRGWRPRWEDPPDRIRYIDSTTGGIGERLCRCELRRECQSGDRADT
jgi:hypothetical protein